MYALYIFNLIEIYLINSNVPLYAKISYMYVLKAKLQATY